MQSSYRERFQLTLEHKAVDRCPIDLGGTPQSTVCHAETVADLARCLGFCGPVPGGYSKFDRRVLEALDVDFRCCGCLADFDTKHKADGDDAFGIRYRQSGDFTVISHSPLEGAGLDEVAAHQFPSLGEIVPGTLEALEPAARKLYEETPYVVVGEHPVYGVLELACWLCGYEHLLTMAAESPEFVHLLFGRILEFQKGIIREYYSRLGRYIHLTTSGDDFGTQAGLMMSPEMWREYVKPCMAERIAYTARFTDAAFMHHSCGSIFDIIPDLIDIGVRILNPIQPHAACMEPERLKAAFGDRLVFHGGLDTQEVLPSGDPALVDEAVDRLLTAMRPCETGGFIFAAAHNIQRDVSAVLVVRMFRRAVRTLGGT